MMTTIRRAHLALSGVPGLLRPLSGRTRLLRPLLVLAPLLAGACGESSPTEPDPTAQNIGVVVNSADVTLTLFDVEDPERSLRTVELGIPDGTPVEASVRGDLALVPMGVWPAAVVVDLRAAAVLRTIPLPAGSGATGSVFLTDSTALVANPDLGSVTPVNVLRGTSGDEIPVGGYPHAFAETEDWIVVVNAELVEFEPARTGTLTLLDRETLGAEGTIELSGENPAVAVSGGGARLFVLTSGRPGAGDGSLSVVDLDGGAELSHHDGFGDFPGGMVRDADGRLHISSWSYGIVRWNTQTASFERGPQNPVAPGGVASSAGVAIDRDGRLHTLFPDCSSPSRVLRLGPDYEVEGEVPVGICPTGLAFTAVQES